MRASEPARADPWSVKMERNWTCVLAGAALFWCGLLVGVSFLATPAKFLAPSLSMPVALDVGRQTFFVFNRAEWVLGAATAIVWLLGTRDRTTGMLAAITCAVVLIETLWLLPLLDARVGLIIAGQTPPISNHHTWYVVIEAVKVISLAVLGIIAANAVLRAK
jgi:hypothetical protein